MSQSNICSQVCGKPEWSLARKYQIRVKVSDGHKHFSLLRLARMFVTVCHFHPSLTFAVKAGVNQSGALQAKIRLG